MAAASPPAAGTALADPKQQNATAGSMGRQQNSNKETMPAYSFGSGTRDASGKVYISAKHEKVKFPCPSPGPVYNQPSTVGCSQKFSFGVEKRKHAQARYPDSSVDLNGASVDSQQVKYDTTKSVHFGTESRSEYKNADVIRVHPGVALGTQSPGALEYSPEACEPKVVKMSPRYSFGPPVSTNKKDKKDEKNAVKLDPTRLHVPPTGTPRNVGPGTHAPKYGLGRQPDSARMSPPSYSFGGSPRHVASVEESSTSRSLRSDASPTLSSDLSSLGKQVVSNHRSAPGCSFGEATRDGVARTQLFVSAADRGPLASLPKQCLHFDLPKVPVGRLPGKHGL